MSKITKPSKTGTEADEKQHGIFFHRFFFQPCKHNMPESEVENIERAVEFGPFATLTLVKTDPARTPARIMAAPSALQLIMRQRDDQIVPVAAVVPAGIIAAGQMGRMRVVRAGTSGGCGRCRSGGPPAIW